MSPDDKPKKQDAFDALDAFASGEGPPEPQPPAPQEPAAPKPATPPPPPPPRKKRAAAPTPQPAQPAEQEPLIPTVDGRSPRPEMPPAVPKAAKPTPAKAVGPAAAKVSPATAPVKAKAVAKAPGPAKPARRKGSMDRRKLARINQQMNFRQTLIPILITLGVIIFALGIMGLMMLPDKTVDPDDQNYDPDNWDDLDPDSPLNKPVTKVAVYLTFPLGLLLWVGAGVLMAQVFGFKAKIRAAEAEAQQEEAA